MAVTKCCMCTSYSRNTLPRASGPPAATRPGTAGVCGACSADLPSTLRDLADADPLPPLPSTGWEETTVLAAAMASDPARFITDLMAHNLALAGRQWRSPRWRSRRRHATVRRALVERTRRPRRSAGAHRRRPGPGRTGRSAFCAAGRTLWHVLVTAAHRDPWGHVSPWQR